MTITRPAATEYPQYFDAYIKKVKQNDLVGALLKNRDEFSALIQSIPTDKGDYRYDDGKWTVKEVLLHCNDAERIFAYRALRFARKDKTELPGWEENDYAPNSNAAERTLSGIHTEFLSIREATLTLFKSFSDEAVMCAGVSNRNIVSVRALGYIIVGHAQHHMEVLKERYL